MTEPAHRKDIGAAAGSSASGADGPLGPDEARFVARVAKAYAPPTATPADAARFEAALASRLARRARPPLAAWLVPAALALVAALLLTTRDRAGAPAPALVSTPVGDAAAESEEDALLGLVAGEVRIGSDALPEDYQAIASLVD